MNSNFVSDLRLLSKFTENLDEFLDLDNEKAEGLKRAVKLFYDNLKKIEDIDDASGDALPDLLIEDFDDEQIYQQIQLHFSSTSGGLLKSISRLISNSQRLTFNLPDVDESSDESEDDLEDLRLNDNGKMADDDETDNEAPVMGDSDDEKEDDDDDEPEKQEDFEEDEGDDEGENPKANNHKKSKNLFDDEPEEEHDEQSTLEKRQEKLKEKIDLIHDSMLENLNNKPWQLKGEVSAKTRPQESLLEEYLQFDHTTKQMPLNTVELTKKIETLIKTRIKDRAFDDVERKIKPIDVPNDYKKEVALNHEKSKMSLSQVYEQDYLDKTKANQNEAKVNPAHEEIRAGLQSLFIKLDALSNFHFKPKPQINDFKIKSNIAAISIENVAPVNVSNTSMLAPNEIHANIDKLPKASAEKDKKEKKRDLKAKRLKLKKIKIKQSKSKNPALDKQNKDLKNLKKLSSLKPNKSDANTTLQVFKPKGSSTNKKSKSNAESLSAKRLKI
jgi:U3 small nucleolar RNA-associated protein MPP10